jgi:hypothetical protein
MGLLDDAIREHLELKRQRGADAEEVEQLEREALGPVVRGDELAPDVAGGEIDPFPSEIESHGVDPETAYEYEHPIEEPPAGYTEPMPEPEPEPEQPPLSPHAGQPTEEFDVESAHAREDAAAEHPAPPEPAVDEPSAPEGEHDVLEETPEFLQETPEHDRLWFEQAPPQDFDFDK